MKLRLPFGRARVFLRVVALLSNLPILRLFRPTGAQLPLGIRQASAEEVPQAVRLILDPAEGPAGEQQIRDFVELAHSASGPAGGLWLCEKRGQVVSGVLPVVSPGKTMLLFVPQRATDSAFESMTRMAIEACCRRAASAGIVLAQTLVEPGEEPIESLFGACSFVRLAELIYLQTPAPKTVARPALGAGLRWVSYSDQTHDLFGHTILSVYSDSLDCPALNGMRKIEDVLAGHKSTGLFSSDRWLLLCEGPTPLAVLLLNGVPRGNAMEIVYLGIVPWARRRGLGKLLMRQAMALCAEARVDRLTLAVDSDNAPALRLYWGHGMQQICRRLALMRDLRL